MSRISRWCFIPIILLVAMTPGVFALDAVATFDEANKLYEQGKFTEAAAAYERIIEAGHTTAEVYFNRGNAHFKAGQIGRAIASYRLAQQLKPRDPDIRANLQFARKQVPGNTAARESLWRRFLHTLTINEWTMGAAATVWVWFILLALGQWRPAWKRSLRQIKLLSGVAAVMFVGCLWARLHAHYFSNPAVVIVPTVDVRFGPIEESQPAFTARDGAELNVLDHKDGWLQVVNSANQTGWLPRETVELLWPKS